MSTNGAFIRLYIIIVIIIITNKCFIFYVLISVNTEPIVSEPSHLAHTYTGDRKTGKNRKVT